MKALVIVHLSSIDSYAWTIGEQKAQALASRISAAIRRHRGPVYIVDQGWDGPIRDQVVNAIRDVPVTWIKFDEDVSPWAPFLSKLKGRLTRDGVTSTSIGGIWYDPEFKDGCATRVYLYLAASMPTKVNSALVGCQTD